MAGIGHITPRRETSDRGLSTGARVPTAKPALDFSPMTHGLQAKAKAMGDARNALKDISGAVAQIDAALEIESDRRVGQLMQDATIHSGRIQTTGWDGADGAKQKALTAWTGEEMSDSGTVKSAEDLPAGRYRAEMSRHIEDEMRKRGFTERDKKKFAERFAPVLERNYNNLFAWQRAKINGEQVDAIGREQDDMAQAARASAAMQYAMDKEIEGEQAKFGTRPDGTAKSICGWIGGIGEDLETEFPFEAEIGGQRRLIPAAVPGLTDEQIERLADPSVISGGIPEDIRSAAVAHAEGRIAEGQSPFAPSYMEEANQSAARLWLQDKTTAIGNMADDLHRRTGGQIGKAEALRRATEYHLKQGEKDIAALADAGAFDRARAYLDAAGDLIKPDDIARLRKGIDEAEKRNIAEQERKAKAATIQNIKAQDARIDALQWNLANEIANNREELAELPDAKKYRAYLDAAVKNGEIDHDAAIKLAERYDKLVQIRADIVAARNGEGAFQWPKSSDPNTYVALRVALDNAQKGYNQMTPETFKQQLETAKEKGLISAEKYISLNHDLIAMRRDRDDTAIRTIYKNLFEVQEIEAERVLDKKSRNTKNGEEAVERLLGSRAARKSPGGALTMEDVDGIEEQVRRYMEANPGDIRGATTLAEELTAPHVQRAAQENIKWRLSRLATESMEAPLDYDDLWKADKAVDLHAHDTPWYLSAAGWAMEKGKIETRQPAGTRQPAEIMPPVPPNYSPDIMFFTPAGW